jgi:S1-C subfamily serine protease
VVTVSVQGAAGPQVFSGVVLSESVVGVTYIVSDRSPFARDRAAGYVGAVNVSFLAGQTARAQLVGEDALSGLAVIQVSDAVTAIPVNVGTVADLHEADQVLSVGSRAVPSVATGVSTGSVSGEDRTVTLVDGTDLDGLIAIAAPSLGAGAAGGPVLNQFGEVVALTLSLDPATSSDQAFTFAVPIDQVTRIATEIIDRAPLTHPWLGVSDAGDLPSATAHQMGVPGGVQAGAVAPGSPAGQAGLRPADVITTFDGKPVSSTGALVSDISVCVPGKVVPMTYVHDGRTVQAAVRIGEEPADE